MTTEAPDAGFIEPSPDVNAEILRLSQLSKVEYETCRKQAAQRLNMRPSALDEFVDDIRPCDNPQSNPFPDPVPWHEPVSGAEILDEIAQIIRRHVVLAPEAADAVALWIMHAHAHGSAEISPLLTISSPAPECGKTTTLDLVSALVPRPLSASNITPAAVFRVVEMFGPTLLIDEADTFINGRDEFVGILNSGHNRAGAYVVRTVGDDHMPTRFYTWAPKSIALIGKPPPTLASRGIHVELQRMSSSDRVEPLRGDRLAKFEPLRRRCWRWAQDHTDELAHADPELPAVLRGRGADNWRHMIAIADLVGGKWPSLARRAAEMLSGRRDQQTDGIMLLEDIRMVMRGRERMPSEELIAELTDLEDRPWCEFGRMQQPLTKRQLAALLKPFGIKPKPIRVKHMGKPCRGYQAASFADAFARYLDNDQEATGDDPGPDLGPTVTSGPPSGKSQSGPKASQEKRPNSRSPRIREGARKRK